MSALLAGLGSALGAFGAGLFGSDEAPDLQGAADKVGTAGLTSSLGETTSPKPDQPTVEGKQASSLLEKTMRDTVQGIAAGGGQRIAKEALDGVFGSATSGSRMGKEARAYLDAAYPELNPWEKAGAGGTMSGAQGGAAAAQNQALDKQLDAQRDIAKANNETQLKQAGLASLTSIKNNQDNLALQAEKQQYEIPVLIQQVENLAAQRDLTDEQRRAAAQSIVESATRVHNIKLDDAQKQAATDKIVEETKQLGGTQSAPGRVIKDLSHYNEVAKEKVSKLGQSIIDKAMPWLNEASDAVQGSFDMYGKALGIQSNIK